MQIHTGGVMSMGSGRIHCQSSKQNMNANFLTEDELIVNSDCVTFNVRMVIFWRNKDMRLTKNMIFQENYSNIRMANNGRDFYGNFRNINMRNLFVKYRVDKVQIEVKYCPT